MNLPDFRQSPSLAAILRDLWIWSVTNINQVGRSKTVRNTYEINSSELYFQFKRKIWNCSLKLPFLHSDATISSNNSNITTSVRISLVDSTVRNNLCHPSFDSNVKYESNFLRGNIRLVFWFPDRQGRWSRSDLFVYHINVTADQSLSENCAARDGVGGGLIILRYSNTCLKGFRTLSLNS